MALPIQLNGPIRNLAIPNADGSAADIVVVLSEAPDEPWAETFAAKCSEAGLEAKLSTHDRDPVVRLPCEFGSVQRRYDLLKTVVADTNKAELAEMQKMADEQSSLAAKQRNVQNLVEQELAVLRE